MDISNEKNKKVEVIFWSIALPGFGQLLNRKYVKGIVLIVFEIMINVKGNINIVIMKSFLGEMQEAILQADYLWLMFYPCVYLFAIWDAYKDAEEAGIVLCFSHLFSLHFYVQLVSFIQVYSQ